MNVRFELRSNDSNFDSSVSHGVLRMKFWLKARHFAAERALSKVKKPQGLKPKNFVRFSSTTEVVPSRFLLKLCPSRRMVYEIRSNYRRREPSWGTHENL